MTLWVDMNISMGVKQSDICLWCQVGSAYLAILVGQM